MLTNSLAQIAAGQAENCIGFAYDSDFHVRHVVSLQELYGNRIIQMEAVKAIFNAEAPTVTLQSEFSEVTLLLGDAAGELYSVIRDLLDKRLNELEAEIVAAHIAMEREDEEQAAMGSEHHQRQKLAADIRHLCTVPPARATVGSPTPGAPTPDHAAPARARQAPQGNTTTRIGVGQNASYGNAAAA
jgi:hypothetical protein